MKEMIRSLCGVLGAGLLALGIVLGGMAAGSARLTEQRAADCLTESSLLTERYEQTAQALRELTDAAGLEYNPDFADFHADVLEIFAAHVEGREPAAGHSPGTALTKAAQAQLDSWQLRPTDEIEESIEQLAQQADELWTTAADLPEVKALAEAVRAQADSPVQRMLWPGAVLAMIGLAAALAGNRKLLCTAAGCIAGGGSLLAASVLGAPAGPGMELTACWYGGLKEFAWPVGCVLLALGAAALAAAAVRRKVRNQG